MDEKTYNIVSLQTARAGSKSVPDKNILNYLDKPMFQHNLEGSLNCGLISKTYVSTDSKNIIERCGNTPQLKGVNIIRRPSDLCKDSSSHYDAILHGLQHIEKDMGEPVDIIVILLGNTPHANCEDLTSAITQFCDKYNDFDSCQSVGKFNMFNPFRAFFGLGDGSIAPIVEHKIAKFLSNRKNMNDKDAFGDIYYFNGSFWIIKKNVFLVNDGKSVFSWLGDKILPFEQQSLYQEIDSDWQYKLLNCGYY